MKQKQAFETVVRENTGWLFGYVKSRVKNPALAEDLVQDIWLRAFRAYPAYYEDGHLRAWLMRIAQNTLRNSYAQSARVCCVSLDADSDDDDPLYTYLSAGQTPEDVYLQKELVAEVMRAVDALPESQRQVITYRFFGGLSVRETARRMGIPEGTVKSKTYHAVSRIRHEMGGAACERKGERFMECQDVYKYLFVYANGGLPPQVRETVGEHLRHCPACADMVTALQRLIPTMVSAKEDEDSHFLIDFPQQRVSYTGVTYCFPDAKACNDYLAAHDGVPPKGSDWLGGGFGKTVQATGMFDNDGNEITFDLVESDSFHYRIHATHIPKVYEHMWVYTSYSDADNHPNSITRSKEAPDLCHGRIRNQFGADIKSALYLAVPKEAENIRIKRGNGVIDAGTYQFPYVDRYVAEDEPIVLECSFLLK